MKYALLIYWNEKEGLVAPASQDDATVERHRRFAGELAQAGQLLGGERLKPEAEGRRVRLRAGKRSVMDGPFAETKEVLGGFYVIEAPSLEAALDVAARCPSAEHGTVEVRPIWAT